jgi:Class II Aldolase and Adducin N-terminal domain
VLIGAQLDVTSRLVAGSRSGFSKQAGKAGTPSMTVTKLEKDRAEGDAASSRLRRELAASQERGLLPLNQMSLEFYNRVAYHDYEGIALSNAEKHRLVADLGDKAVMILRNHGLLTVGVTPGQAFLRMFYLERSCEIQVDALAGGAPIVTPPPDVCEHTARQFEGGQSKDDYSIDASPNLAWAAMLRLVERLYPDYKD